MRLATIIRLRLRSLFLRKRVEAELDEELRYHLEREASPAIAGIEQRKEECRDTRGLNLLDNLAQDFRYAIRQLRKSPGFAATSIFVLALGIAANVAIFAFVDAALIKPLPYHDPGRLVSIFETNRTSEQYPASYPNYLDWKRLNKLFRSVDAYDMNGGLTLTTSAGPELVAATRVSAGFFRTLGVSPVLGRDFENGEDSVSAPETVLLSYSAWQQRYGGRPDALGQTVTLNGTPRTIVGVLPRDFYFTPTGSPEFWATLRESGATFHESDPCEKKRGCHNTGVIGRLNEEVTVQAALASMQSLAHELEKQYPDSNRDQGANVLALSEVIVGNVRPILLMLLCGANLLLLIACINVTSLLLARSDGRQREMAVRGALGASRARLFRQFATEGLVLVALGSSAGLIAGGWFMQILKSLIPAGMVASMPFLAGLGLNLRLVAYACCISLIAGVLFALAPMARARLTEMLEDLKEGSRTSAGTTWRRLGANLVVAEIAVAMVLLVGAGLLGKSLYLLLHESVGFAPDHLATLAIEAPAASYSKKELFIALEQQLVEQVGQLAGVKSVGVSNGLPVGGIGTVWIRVVGRPFHGEHNEVSTRVVSATYFSTLGARLWRGRYFDETEDSSKPLVVIINRTMARQYFPNEDPIGKQIAPTVPPRPPIEIVGVVDDVREGSLDSAPRPVIYRPFNQASSRFVSLIVRTSHADGQIFPSLAAVIHRINPAILIHGEATMTERINNSPAANMHRSSTWLVGGFAAVAFLLSVVGLYGVVAYSVSRRTREIGIRMALGARRESVYRLILREAAWLAGVGTVLGIGGSIAATTLMRRLLFGVRSWDVPTLAAAALALVISALLASYIPARRAACVNPVEALRAE